MRLPLLLVPREQFQLRTGLDPAAVWARLTLPGQAFVAASPGGGAVDFYGDDFQLQPVTHPSDWWSLPTQISGVIGNYNDPTDSGCLLTVCIQPVGRAVLLWAGWRLGLIVVSLLLMTVPPPASYYVVSWVVLAVSLLLNNVFSARFQRSAADAKAYLVETLRDYPLPEPDAADNLALPPMPSPAATQRLPRRWVGGTPAAQRYGWGAESPPLPPPSEDGDAHETQRLPPARGDSFAATALPSAGAGGDNSELAPTIQS